MNINTVKSLEFYCKNEIRSLKESNFLSRILLLSKSLDYDVDLSVGEALDVKESKYPKIEDLNFIFLLIFISLYLLRFSVYFLKRFLTLIIFT